MKNATATAKDERYELEFMPFMATTEEEQQLHPLIRRMLHYHILRVQIEDCKPGMSEGQRAYAVRMATRARVEGFQIEREAIDSGIRVDYDDELLRQEAIRIAYAINRGQVEQALSYEEEVITLVITRSLYGTEELRIAA
jgi:hypothetical protein